MSLDIHHMNAKYYMILLLSIHKNRLFKEHRQEPTFKVFWKEAIGK